MSDVLNVTGYKSFEKVITGTRESWGKESRGFYVLTAEEQTEISILRYYTPEADGVLSLIFRKKDAYFIAWKTPKGELYIFNNEIMPFKGLKAISDESSVGGKITPIDLADAIPVGIDSSYVRIQARYKVKRSKVALGQKCIIGALELLAGMKKRGGYEFLKKIAESSIVIMQMIPECLRFEAMLTYVKEVFKNDRPPLEELIQKQNAWNTLCQEIHTTETPNLTAKQRDLKLIKAAKYM